LIVFDEVTGHPFRWCWQSGEIPVIGIVYIAVMIDEDAERAV
jgi:hypothetical protein